MLTKQINLNSKFFYQLLLILFWGKDHIFAAAKAIFGRIPIVSMFADYIVPIVAVVCLVMALPYIAQRITGRDIMFFLIIAILYGLNLLIYKNTFEYLCEISYTFWMTVVPLYFLGLCIDAEEDFPIIYKVSILNVIYLVAYTLLLGEGMSEQQSLYQGAMHRAYVLLPHVLMVTAATLKKATIWNVLVFVLGAIYLFLCGTRGAVLSLFIFIVLYCVFFKPIRKHIAMYSIIFGIMLLIFIFYEDLLLIIQLIARTVGMSERIVSSFISGTFWSSNSRQSISTVVLEAISQKPIFGYGIAGDRAIIGYYVHNLLLEFLVSFGMIAGSIFFILLNVLIINGFRKSENFESKVFVVILFCSVYIKLFMSSSYLLESYLLLMLGFCINQIRKSKARIMIELDENQNSPEATADEDM